MKVKLSKTVNIILVSVIILGILIRFDIKDRPIRYNQGEFAYTANLMLNHGYKYLDVVNNKPPGGYYFYIIFFKIFGNKISTLYLTGILSDIAIIFLIFLISHKLFNKSIALLSAALYSTHYLAFNFSWGGFLELPMMVFTLSSMYVYLLALDRKNVILFFISGVFIGLSFLIKQPGIIIFFTYLLYLFFLVLYKKIEKNIFLKYSASVLSGLLSVLAGLLIYLIKLKILSKFIYIVFYVSTVYGPSFPYKIKLILNIVFAALPFLALLSLIIVLKSIRRLNLENLFLLCWLFPIIFFLIFTKDFQPHYLIQLIPALVIIVSGFFYKIKINNPFRYFIYFVVFVMFTYNFSLILIDVYNHHVHHKNYIDVGFLNNKYMLNYEQDTWINIGMQKRVAYYILNNTNNTDRIITTNPVYAYLSNKTINYRFAWISPMIMAISDNIADFGVYASKSKYFIYDLNSVSSLEKAGNLLNCIKKNWRYVDEISDTYITIYENTNKTACLPTSK